MEPPPAVVEGLPEAGDQDFTALNTLDEPIMATIMRDVRSIVDKFVHVYTPGKQKKLLKDWDLWGPLVICVFLAVILQTSADTSKSEAVPHFAELFVLVWGGAALVTLNTMLLGAQLAFFQGLCVLGYCLCGQCVALVVCKLLPLLPFVSGHAMTLFILSALLSLLGCAWSILAASGTFSGLYGDHKNTLIRYPIFLYYVLISWLILSWSNSHC